VHDPTFGAGLMGDQGHAQHSVGDFGRFRGVLRDLDPATFAAPAGVYLRLYYNAAADFFCGRFRLLDSERHFSPRHRDVVLGQESLGLILMNFHGIPVALLAHEPNDSL
jgi:hypothetical protein